MSSPPPRGVHAALPTGTGEEGVGPWPRSGLEAAGCRLTSRCPYPGAVGATEGFRAGERGARGTLPRQPRARQPAVGREQGPGTHREAGLLGPELAEGRRVQAGWGQARPWTPVGPAPCTPAPGGQPGWASAVSARSVGATAQGAVGQGRELPESTPDQLHPPPPHLGQRWSPGRMSGVPAEAAEPSLGRKGSSAASLGKERCSAGCEIVAEPRTLRQAT